MPTSAQTAPVEAVLFDYGLVLTGPPDPEAWARMKALLSADEEAFHSSYWRWRHDYDLGALSGHDYWRQVGSDLHRDLSATDLASLIDADIHLWTQPNQPMMAWAAQLQAAGIRTGILSNLGDAMEAGVLARCGWLGDFAHRTFSHRLRIAKPAVAIYAHAAKGLAVPAPNVLFIDDREDNIEGARQAGMQAIRYTDHPGFLSAMRAAGLSYLLFPTPRAPGPHPIPSTPVEAQD